MAGGFIAIGQEAVQPLSFDLVFSLHHDYVYSLVCALLPNPQDAEDITQEVFLRVFRALSSYDPERASMRTWLSRLTVNACQTQRRRNFLSSVWRRNSVPIASEDEVDAIDLSSWGAPEDQALQTEIRRTVRQVLARLKPEHRTVIVLHYYMDLPCNEIAQVLECPEGTVHSRLHYARRLVQRELERLGARQEAVL